MLGPVGVLPNGQGSLEPLLSLVELPVELEVFCVRFGGLPDAVARFGRRGGVWLTNLIGQDVLYDLRHEVFEHIETLGLRFFDSRPVGRRVR